MRSLLRHPAVSVAAALLVLLSAFSASGREPTEYEQYMIELVNRARLDPAGEVALLGTGSLNEGPPTLGGFVYTIPAGPHQPVAIGESITDAASDYAQLMNDNDTFCHTCLGSTSSERMWLAGYVPMLSYFDFFDVAGYTLLYGGATDPACMSGCLTYVPGRENLAFRGEGPPNGFIDDLVGAIDQAHEGLFNDFTVPSRGHRSTMMYGEWKELGIGMIEGQDGGGSSDTIYIVQNFAHRSDTGPFITGVAYQDLVDDDFYTPAAFEALGGLTVTAYLAGTTTVAATTTTMAAGGYNLDVGVGTYDVVASGMGFYESYPGVAVLASGPGGLGENTKLDIIPTPEPGFAAGLVSSGALLALLRRRRGTRRGE